MGRLVKLELLLGMSYLIDSWRQSNLNSSPKTSVKMMTYAFIIRKYAGGVTQVASIVTNTDLASKLHMLPTTWILLL